MTGTWLVQAAMEEEREVKTLDQGEDWGGETSPRGLTRTTAPCSVFWGGTEVWKTRLWEADAACSWGPGGPIPQGRSSLCSQGRGGRQGALTQMQGRVPQSIPLVRVSPMVQEQLH